jgi:general secretion pathway protein E
MNSDNLQNPPPLCLLPNVQRALEEALERPGLVLFTGPTGSGKSTTIEVLLAQRGTLAAKRSSSTHFPDLSYVGDIRTPASARNAVEQSTGRVVVGVLRSGESRGVIGRFADMGIHLTVTPPGSLTIATQRLCRRLCQFCKHPVAISGSEILSAQLAERGFELSDHFVFSPTGCPRCEGLGYAGWIPLFEVLVLTDTQDFIGEGLEDRMTSRADLANDATVKLIGGATSLEEVRRVLPISSQE